MLHYYLFLILALILMMALLYMRYQKLRVSSLIFGVCRQFNLQIY